MALHLLVEHVTHGHHSVGVGFIGIDPLETGPVDEVTTFKYPAVDGAILLDEGAYFVEGGIP